MTSPRDRWLSRKDWRRLVELHAAGRIGRADLASLKERLSRVREGPRPAPRAAPRLHLLPGGAGQEPPPPSPGSTPRRAA